MSETYTASDLHVLKGLSAVRMRPGMYIGSTGSRGLHHMLWEIVDNAMDEAANGYADKIDITINEDYSVTVEDNGRGIPTGIHPELGISGVEVVFTQLHAGGKFDNSNYAFSGGLHGVGASVVNALSKWLIAEVFQDGKHYLQKYTTYADSTGEVHAGEPTEPLHIVGTSNKRGSRITYMADDDIFDDLDLHFEKVSRRLKELSFLIKGVTVNLTDKRGEKPKTASYCYSGGTW